MIQPKYRMWIASGCAAAVSVAALVGLIIWPQDPEARLAKAAPGTMFHDCAAGPPSCPDMIVLPAGSFTMGTPLSVPDVATEQPPQIITLPRFAISKYEITFAEWRACVSAGACAAASVPGAVGDSYPAANMNWSEAGQYADWLSKSTGHAYRLPSEAEWEYAARGVTDASAPSTDYWWGAKEPICEKGARHGANTVYCNLGRAEPVGTFAANPFGLYDVAGNVWEWVQDCYRPTLSNQPANGAPVLTGDCMQRVVRGGSWVARPDVSRSADRSHAEDRDTGIGLRLVRVLR